MNQQDSFQTACFVFYETCFPLYNSSQSTGRLKVLYVFSPTQTYSDHQIAPSWRCAFEHAGGRCAETRFPDCEIDMLVYAGTEQLIADNPQIAQILTIDRNWRS